MSSHRPPRHDGSDAEGGPTVAFRHQNGPVVATTTTTGGDPPRTGLATPAVPKMGVRARVADWPPKRDATKDLPGNREASVWRSSPGGHQISSGVSGLKALHRLARRRSKEAEFQEGWDSRPPGAALVPLRHRSSSEVTLAECEPREGGESRGNPGLFREYGSTSSIDVQGVSEQSFFQILKEFRGGENRTEWEKGGEKAFPAGSSPESLKAGGKKEEPKEKSRRKCPKNEDSIFKKLRSGRNEGETGKEGEEFRGPAPESGKPWVCQKSFAHYDVQSMLFDLASVATKRAVVAQRRNTTTGASAASAPVGGGVPGGSDTPVSNPEDPNRKENLEEDLGDSTSNDLLLSCPHFRNEIGGGAERNVSFSRASPGFSGGLGKEMGGGLFSEPPFFPLRPPNAAVSVLEVPKELQKNLDLLKRHSVEHVDLGARYYRDHFHGKEHSNYFGLDEKLGPVAVSIRRERLGDTGEHGPQFQYRIIFRTSELLTLRGSILEDATPTATKAGSGRGLPPRDALEYVLPELNIQCLRLALGTPKVTDQLLKLDEQGLCRRHKVGILYCRAGQSSEEEMYNNEGAGPPFEEFLSLLGEKVPLKAFPKYAAQLDTKTDSTGTHSLYTTFQDYEIMFHVSTMLPYTPNNRQQLLRKRHIGNDIVTIIFQEPGALPFTPQNIRSHFQHVFIIVRAHNPCTDSVSYSVAVTRSKDVPPFGPPIPEGVTFRKSDVFRDFLLAKVINAENAAHKSDKFHTMATRTRQEYLKDLAENYVTNTPIDSAGKFNLISLASKKKEKTKARVGAEQHSAGAIAWRVFAQDFARGVEITCILGISNEFLVLLDLGAKEVVFNCFCGDVIGWTADTSTLKIFYGRGDHIFIRAAEGGPEDIKEIVQRLKVVTEGCETVDMTLRRNGLGQLGFHVKADGTVAEVEDYGFAWQAGLRQGSRLVEICKVAVVTLSHDQMIDLLRTSVTVKVVIVPPHEDGAPRRGWAESLEPSGTEPKGDGESLPSGYRPPYRSSPGWAWSGPASHNNPPVGKWAEPPPGCRGGTRDPQGGHGRRPLSFPDTPQPSSSSSSSSSSSPPPRPPSGSFSAPPTAGPTAARYKPPPDRYVASQRPPHDGSSSGGFGSHEGSVERPRAATGGAGGAPPPRGVGAPPPPSKVTPRGGEPLWHLPARPGGGKRAGKDSPSRHLRMDPPFSSPSSDASSSHSEERGGGGPLDPPEPPQKGSDSPPHAPPPPGGGPSAPRPPRPSPQRDKDPFKPPSSASRGGFPGYDPPRPPQLSASVPKSFFSKQPGRGRQGPPPRARPEDPPEPQKQAEGGGGRNVFGQPRLRASLRDLRSPRRSYKSTVEDDLKKLILMDSAAPPEPHSPPPPKGLQRTLSDESLCGGRRGGPEVGGGNPFITAGGTLTPDPEILFASTLPGRRPPPAPPANGGLPERTAAISASELALDKAPPPRPGLMPLPDTTATGLEWASLVNAAKAYEVQRAVSLFSLAEPPLLSPDPPAPPDRHTLLRGGAPPLSQTPPPLDLPGKVSQLEAMLRQLHSDLQKEKQDKVFLQAEVATLRQNNRRLQEESHSAARQLRRFARLLGTGDTEQP